MMRIDFGLAFHPPSALVVRNPRLSDLTDENALVYFPSPSNAPCNELIVPSLRSTLTFTKPFSSVRTSEVELIETFGTFKEGRNAEEFKKVAPKGAEIKEAEFKEAELKEAEEEELAVGWEVEDTGPIRCLGGS